MLGLKSFRSAAITLARVELAHRIHWQIDIVYQRCGYPSLARSAIRGSSRLAAICISWSRRRADGIGAIATVMVESGRRFALGIYTDVPIARGRDTELLGNCSRQVWIRR